MQASSAEFVDGLSAEEACPLCLHRYASVDECVCVTCRAPSCPGCAEVIARDGSMRCYACLPAVAETAVAETAVAETVPERKSCVIPKPIYVAARKLNTPMDLPFPLTSSPRGPRRIEPLPMGSVHLLPPPLPTRKGPPPLPVQRAMTRDVVYVAADTHALSVTHSSATSGTAQGLSRRMRSELLILGRSFARYAYRVLEQRSRDYTARVRAHAARKMSEPYRRSLMELYSSGLRSLKKPIDALSSRILAKSKSATMTPSSDRPSSVTLSPR
jgi:hypothetical protein